MKLILCTRQTHQIFIRWTTFKMFAISSVSNCPLLNLTSTLTRLCYVNNESVGKEDHFPLLSFRHKLYYSVTMKDNVFEPRHDKTCLLEFPTRPDTNRPVQPQKLARVLKFRLSNLEILYYLSSEQQRCWSDCVKAQAYLHLCCSHIK